MDLEINLDSIRALEKKIQEHERAIINLKRARNSLLNVSTLPPEVLGSIFRWNAIPVGDWGGLRKGSYNFLLVCHHWFQVASATPELWCFWGNSMQDWRHRHALCRAAPLDLVLITSVNHDLDDGLRGALQDCAARGVMRRVHLDGSYATTLLSSVISSIVTKGEETQSISMESFILRSSGGPSINISDFFSRYHFPKLQHLDLYGFNISSWDLLGSRITSLTTLLLTSDERLPPPTLSQMLLILSANPNLQSLTLSKSSVPPADSDGFSSQIQPRHLKRLHLTSNFGRVFGLLDRLELPDKMDSLYLSLSECSPSDLLQTLGPYLGNRVRRRFPGGLGISVDCGPNFSFLSILVGDAREDGLIQGGWYMAVDGTTNVTLGEEEADELCFDIIAHIPQEVVVYLTTMSLPILRSEELCVRMCNVTHINLEQVDLSTWFAEPDTREPHASEDLLRGLRSISIADSSLSGDDWGPFTRFLTCRAAVGNRISSLHFSNCPYMSEGVAESIKCAVGVFHDEDEDRRESGGNDGD
jgi:hypothetical protein